MNLSVSCFKFVALALLLYRFLRTLDAPRLEAVFGFPRAIELVNALGLSATGTSFEITH